MSLILALLLWLHRGIWPVLQTPKTCENFIKLCKKQYYDGTVFHRSIRNFVVRAPCWPQRAMPVAWACSSGQKPIG